MLMGVEIIVSGILDDMRLWCAASVKRWFELSLEDSSTNGRKEEQNSGGVWPSQPGGG